MLKMQATERSKSPYYPTRTNYRFRSGATSVQVRPTQQQKRYQIVQSSGATWNHCNQSRGMCQHKSQKTRATGQRLVAIKEPYAGCGNDEAVPLRHRWKTRCTANHCPRLCEQQGRQAPWGFSPQQTKRGSEFNAIATDEASRPHDAHAEKEVALKTNMIRTSLPQKEQKQQALPACESPITRSRRWGQASRRKFSTRVVTALWAAWNAPGPNPRPNCCCRRYATAGRRVPVYLDLEHRPAARERTRQRPSHPRARRPRRTVEI